MELNRVKEIKIDNRLITIQKENILSLLGYENSNTDEHVDEVIEKCIKESTGLIQPRGGIVFLKNDGIILSEGKIYAGDQEFHVGKIIAAQLKNVEYIALFICTIGSLVENHSKQHMESGDLLEGYIFDLIGSETAEVVAEILHEVAKEIAGKEQLNISNRFSPGYCEWDVKEQFKLFSFFTDDNFNISLTSSALMHPVKSVSGIIGIGENVKFKPYTCSMCSDENCIYRNKKNR